MAKYVIKRDGSREVFDPEKIRNAIRAAAQSVNLPVSRVEELVQDVSVQVLRLTDSKEEIQTAEIKGEALRDLDAADPQVSEAWRRYDREKGRV